MTTYACSLDPHHDEPVLIDADSVEEACALSERRVHRFLSGWRPPQCVRVWIRPNDDWSDASAVRRDIVIVDYMSVLYVSGTDRYAARRIAPDIVRRALAGGRPDDRRLWEDIVQPGATRMDLGRGQSYEHAELLRRVRSAAPPPRIRRAGPDAAPALSQVAAAAERDAGPRSGARYCSHIALEALRMGLPAAARHFAGEAEAVHPQAYAEFAGRVARLADYLELRRRRGDPETGRAAALRRRPAVASRRRSG